MNKTRTTISFKFSLVWSSCLCYFESKNLHRL